MTKVEGQKFVAICNRLGLAVTEQPSQYKVVGPEDRRFYIPGTKAVRKVELSGWSHPLAVEWKAVYPNKAPPSKRITHVVDFGDRDERLILKDFYRMAKDLAGTSQAPEELPEEPLPAPEAQVA